MTFNSRWWQRFHILVMTSYEATAMFRNGRLAEKLERPFLRFSKKPFAVSSSNWTSPGLFDTSGL